MTEKYEPGRPSRSAPRETTSKNRYRILLVDDSEDNREIMLSLLSRRNYLVDLAEDGRQALDRFKLCRYDLILMDVQMPGMDGYEATRQIRQWERDQSLHRTPILGLTAYAFNEDAIKTAEAGCDAHLTKPILRQTLLDTVAYHLGRGNSASFSASNDILNLIPGYLKNRRRDIASVAEAMEHRDFKTIEVIGHRIRGSGGGYGMPELGKMAGKLEEAAAATQLQEIRDTLTVMIAELERLEATAIPREP